MRHTPLLAGLMAVALLGAGCFSKSSTPTDSVSLHIPDAKTGSILTALPCLLFKDSAGFAKWLDAYDAGHKEATTLAVSAKLPTKADAKLTTDMRQSLNTGATPTFVCTLDDQGKNVVWITEPAPVKDTECHDLFYVSLNGNGTTSDLKANGRTTDCNQLCKPKQQDPDILVWQCDLRQGNGTSTWSQMNMNRTTGKSEIVKCQNDKLGTPSGCVK